MLQYIATLANSNDNQDQFNYEFVESLLKGGADPNIADQYGQSIFHEVARSWNVDVAKFLLKNGILIFRHSLDLFNGGVITKSGPGLLDLDSFHLDILLRTAQEMMDNGLFRP